MAKIVLDPGHSLGSISKNIYGHFSEHLGRCIYQGLFVGRDSPIPNVNGMRTDAVEALKRISAPVLRWPGGCFADEYHWEDGIGPLESRKRMVNTNWGGVVEDNSFGTHEFLELCRQIGCEPYINGNVGSGTVREMAEWVEYLNSDGDSTVVRRRRANGRQDAWNVRFFGVGNESWGCGGNMRPEYYADEFRRYATFCRQYGKSRLFKIACGPNSDDYQWTKVLMERAGRYMDGLSLHYYTLCGDWQTSKGSATRFTEEEYYRTLYRASVMEELVTKHGEIMDKADPEKRVALIVDEWGTWYDVEEGTNPGFLYQQNTMRDAVCAAITLNIFNRHCDRVRMANLAQTVNVLQAVILTEGEKMVLTPTYHVFDLFRDHMDAKEVACAVEAEPVCEGEWAQPQVSASASEKDGVITLTAANLSAAAPVRIAVSGVAAKACEGRILAGAMDEYNDFDRSPLAVKPFEDCRAEGGEVTAVLPPSSVAAIRITV